MHYAELFRGHNGQWFYRIMAMNHQVIAQSEGYHTKWGCKRAVLRNHPDVERITVVHV